MRFRQSLDASRSMALLILVVSTGCLPGAGDSWGEPVPPGAALSLDALLQDPQAGPDGHVVVRGRISEVCTSSGCWFVLQQNDSGLLRQVTVDLIPEAGFTLPASVRGHDARVKGRLVGEGPDRRLNATGVVLE